jgi:hypothetical protein
MAKRMAGSQVGKTIENPRTSPLPLSEPSPWKVAKNAAFIELAAKTQTP